MSATGTCQACGTRGVAGAFCDACRPVASTAAAPVPSGPPRAGSASLGTIVSLRHPPVPVPASPAPVTAAHPGAFASIPPVRGVDDPLETFAAEGANAIELGFSAGGFDDAGAAAMGHAVEDPLSAAWDTPDVDLGTRDRARALGKPRAIRRVVRAGSGDPNDALDPDLVEAREVADYGPVPAGWWSAMTYALHVLTRRPDLERACALAKTSLDRARADAEDAFAELGRAVFEARGDAAYRAVRERIAAVEHASSIAANRSARIAEVDQRLDQHRREFALRERDLDSKLDELRGREAEAAEIAQAREMELKRLQARAERAEIDARSLASQLQSGTEGRAQLAAAAAEIDRRSAERMLAEGALRDAARTLANVRRDIAAATGQLAILREERRRLDAHSSRAKTRHTSTHQDASEALRQALIELGRDVVLRGVDTPTLPTSVFEPHLDSVERAERSLHVAQLATRCYDRAGYRRGLASMGALVAAIVVVGIVALAR